MYFLFFSSSKIKCPIAFALTSFTNLRVLDAMLPGETCRHLSVRVGEHSGVSPLTAKKSKSKKFTAVKDHILFVIILYLLMTLNFWQPVTQISMLRLKKVF